MRILLLALILPPCPQTKSTAVLLLNIPWSSWEGQYLQPKQATVSFPVAFVFLSVPPPLALLLQSVTSIRLLRGYQGEGHVVDKFGAQGQDHGDNLHGLPYTHRLFKVGMQEMALTKTDCRRYFAGSSASTMCSMHDVTGFKASTASVHSTA